MQRLSDAKPGAGRFTARYELSTYMEFRSALVSTQFSPCQYHPTNISHSSSSTCCSLSKGRGLGNFSKQRSSGNCRQLDRKYFHLLIVQYRKLDRRLVEPHSLYGRCEEEENLCPYRNSNPGSSRMCLVAIPTALIGLCLCLIQIRSSRTRHTGNVHQYEQIKTFCADV